MIQQVAIRRLAFSTSGSVHDVAGLTVGAAAIPDETLLRGAYSISTEAGGPEVTGGNEAGTSSNIYP